MTCCPAGLALAEQGDTYFFEQAQAGPPDQAFFTKQVAAGGEGQFTRPEFGAPRFGDEARLHEITGNGWLNLLSAQSPARAVSFVVTAQHQNRFAGDETQYLQGFSAMGNDVGRHRVSVQ